MSFLFLFVGKMGVWGAKPPGNNFLRIPPFKNTEIGLKGVSLVIRTDPPKRLFFNFTSDYVFYGHDHVSQG